MYTSFGTPKALQSRLSCLRGIRNDSRVFLAIPLSVKILLKILLNTSQKIETWLECFMSTPRVSAIMERVSSFDSFIGDNSFPQKVNIWRIIEDINLCLGGVLKVKIVFSEI